MTIQVVKLGFIGLNTTDYPGMVGHFRDVVGLPAAAQTADATFLACGSESHALALFRDAPQGRRIRHIGFRVDRAVDLDEVEKDLGRSGVAARRKSDALPGIGDLVEIVDPDGNVILLYSESQPSKAPYSTTGVGPNKLGHIAIFVKDAVRSAEFYTEVMGFRWSDWCENMFVFMRCNADHHSLNLTTGKNPRLWHIAWELQDFSHIGRACDVLSRHGKPLLWGPGRHGMGHNLFAYHRDPDGNITEFCADIDRMATEGVGHWDPRPHHEHAPQGPMIWPAGPESSNLWGIMPPPGFME